MLFELLLLAYATLASAQTSSIAASTSSSSGSASPASSISQTTPHPTHSVFFPGDLPSGATNLAASVITANINQTAYAIGCPPHPTNASTASPGECRLPTSLTVTGGPSTLIYTYHPDSDGQPTLSPTSDPLPSGLEIDDAGGATLNCELYGGTSASQAICTGSSSISGLGLVGSTTTLASTQIDYATFTVTAGFAALSSASQAAAASASASGNGNGGSSGAAMAGAGSAGWVIGAAGICVGIGVLAL